MKLPAPLTADKDFMLLRAQAFLGTRETEQRSIDTLLTLAFVKGEAEGCDQALRIFRGEAA